MVSTPVSTLSPSQSSAKSIPLTWMLLTIQGFTLNFDSPWELSWVSQVAQWQRIHLPMQETQETSVRSLGREDLLEKEMATLSGILAWRIPWTEEPGGLQFMGSQEGWTRLSNSAQHAVWYKGGFPTSYYFSVL